MKTLKQLINHWGYVSNYADVPQNLEEYEKLQMLADALMEWLRDHHDDRVASLLRLIASNIELYENTHFPSKKVSAVDVLIFLMEEHHLGQADLPEIGSQSLVSKILSGEKQLTLGHVRRLSKRFHVSPVVFF